MSKILRITLFKIPNPSHVEEAIAKYSTLSKDAVKVKLLSYPTPIV
jgi:hypothetical protein